MVQGDFQSFIGPNAARSAPPPRSILQRALQMRLFPQFLCPSQRRKRLPTHPARPRSWHSALGDASEIVRMSVQRVAFNTDCGNQDWRVMPHPFGNGAMNPDFDALSPRSPCPSQAPTAVCLEGPCPELGWRPEQIRVLDTDLRLSGTQMNHRQDFQTLVADVSLRKVGAGCRTNSPAAPSLAGRRRRRSQLRCSAVRPR